MARMCTKFLKRRWSQSVKTARCATSFWTGNNDVQNARGVFTSDQGHRHHGAAGRDRRDPERILADPPPCGECARRGAGHRRTGRRIESRDAVLCANASIGQSPKTRTGATRAGFKPPDLELKPLEQSLEQRAQPVDDGAQTDAQLRTLPPLHAPSPGVDKQVEALVAAWDHPPQSQKILGIQTLESTAERENAPPAAHGPAGRSTTSALASTDLQPLIHATDQYGAHLENAIDTDAPSEVLAVLDQGPCKGAQLIGSSQLTHEALSVTFTAMHGKDKTYAIQAMALNDQTLGRALPADVDHRYGQRIVTPAILGALGAAGAVYGNAGKTILHSPLGGYTEQTDANPSIRQIGGAAAAAGLSGVQNALAQQAA